MIWCDKHGVYHESASTGCDKIPYNRDSDPTIAHCDCTRGRYDMPGFNYCPECGEKLPCDVYTR